MGVSEGRGNVRVLDGGVAAKKGGIVGYFQANGAPSFFGGRIRGSRLYWQRRSRGCKSRGEETQAKQVTESNQFFHLCGQVKWLEGKPAISTVRNGWNII